MDFPNFYCSTHHAFACSAFAGLLLAQVDPYTLPTFRLTAGISGNASSSDSSGAHTPFDDILTETEIVVIDENDEVVEVIPSQLVRFV